VEPLQSKAKNGNMDGETLEKLKESQMMPVAVTTEKRLLSAQNTQEILLRSFRMRSLMPSFPKQVKKQSFISELAWKKSTQNSTTLPDDPEEEVPWYEQE